MPVLPPGTPEEGMYVVTSWGGANHGLTISGYHDSICWDYNNDGQYTNDIDLNGDGVITPSDWEIGGFRFANTYSGGPNFGNDGFSYMTYKSAADPYGDGGIWNSAIHVIYTKANADPLLTAKVTLKHTCREQIRVRIGVATDQSSENPDYILSLPVFNFQGGCKYMQGDTTEAAKTIEFGLDLTPFLNMIGTNTPARYFLLVDEDDPNNWSPGEIVQYSLMDYTNGMIEIPCNQSNIGIVNNSLTKAWVDHTVNFDEVEITTDTLPPATVFEPYSVNLEATGGTEPFVWDYDMNFTETNYNSSFPMVSDEELYPGGGYATKFLDFAFPFYGEEFNTVRVYADGYIMFEGSINWPYQVYDFLLFTKNKYVAPFMTDLNLYSGIGDGLWYKGDTTSAIFRWKASVDGMQNTSVLNFAVELHKNGDIKLYYGSLNDYPIMEWISGVSAGDNKYYQFTEVNSDPSIPQEYVCDLRAFHQPDGFIVSRDGIFGGTPTEIYDNLEIKFRAQDENGLSNSEILYFSTDGTSYLVVNDFSVISGDDDLIEFGETVSLSVDIKNLGEEAIYGASIEISSENIYIVLVDSTEFLGDFGPGQIKTFETAFVFDIDNLIPDEFDIDINTYIADNSGNDWSSHIYLTAFAPEIYVGGVAIDDGGGGGLDPGETADMIVNLCNGGGATAENLVVTLSSSDPYVTINSNIANLSILNGNDVGQVTFNITASDQTPMGHILEFDVYIEADNDYVISDVAFVLVGLINESFETGDFSSYPWSFGGDSEWIIDNEEFFEGAFSARSGDIDDDQKSSLLLNIYVIGDGEISFYKKVSSEASYDYLRFFIDGEELVSWAGRHGLGSRYVSC